MFTLKYAPSAKEKMPRILFEFSVGIVERSYVMTTSWRVLISKIGFDSAFNRRHLREFSRAAIGVLEVKIKTMVASSPNRWLLRRWHRRRS
jgi:hypothetical protein